MPSNPHPPIIPLQVDGRLCSRMLRPFEEEEFDEPVGASAIEFDDVGWPDGYVPLFAAPISSPPAVAIPVDPLQARALAFWEEAAKLPLSGSPGGLCHLQLRSTAFLNDSRSEQFQQTVVGSATRHEIEDLFHPASYSIRARRNRNGGYTQRRGSGAGRSRIFRGEVPEDFAVIPFWNSPSNIAGFLFVDPHDNQPEPSIFKAVGRALRRPREGGLAMLNSMTRLAPWDDLAGVVFVFLDVMLALRTQLRWRQTSFRPLPIVVAIDDARQRSNKVWQTQAKGRRIIIGSPEDERVIRQARLAGARISRRELGERELLQDSWTALASLRRALKKTTSWQKALRSAMLRRDADAAAELLFRMEMHPGERTEFLQRGGRALRKHLAQAADQHRLAPRIPARGQIVVERDGGWFIERTGVRISDIVRVTGVLWRRNHDSVLRGYVLTEGVKRPFQVPKSRVRQVGLFSCLREHFTAQEQSFEFLRGWSGRSEFMTEQFRPPKQVHDADVVGWSKVHTRLCLPQFAIGVGGHIHDDRRTQLVDPDSPARNLVPPVALHFADVRPLTFDSPVNNLFWAVLVPIVYNLMAPAYTAKPMGVLLTGTGADALATTIAESFGCRTVQLDPRGRLGASFERLDQQVAYHPWPTIVDLETQPPRSADFILANLTRNGFAMVAKEAVGAAQDHGWYVLQADHLDEANDLIWRFGATITLNYVRDLLRRRLDYGYHPDGLFRAIWSDLASWFSDLARGRQAVLGAERNLIAPPTEWGKWRATGSCGGGHDGQNAASQGVS